MRIWHLILACLCGALALAAAAVARVESRATMLAAGGIETHFAALRDGPVPAPLSIRGMRGILVACDDALSRDGLAFQPEPARARVIASCDGAVARADRVAGDWALAHHVAAAIATAKGDDAAARVAQATSRALAPHEGWLARRRLLAAEENGWLTGPDPAPADADIRTLLQGDLGRAALAAAARAAPGLRDRILRLAEAEPPAVQRAFLDAVRRDREGG